MVHSSAMKPNIPHGSLGYLIPLGPTDKIERWEVVAFMPKVSSNYWAMRVLGLPGETVDMASNRVVINGIPLAPPAHVRGQFNYQPAEPVPGAMAPVKLPIMPQKDFYFILGDNTRNAYDSRFFGAIHRTNIMGKVEF